MRGAWAVMSEPPSAAIEVARLTKRFGGVPRSTASASTCAAGEMFGLVGPDGAGKTTIMRMLAGVMTPDEGSTRSTGSTSVADPEGARRTSATCRSASASTRT